MKKSNRKFKNTTRLTKIKTQCLKYMAYSKSIPQTEVNTDTGLTQETETKTKTKTKTKSR